jgi:hypothetical protein
MRLPELFDEAYQDQDQVCYQDGIEDYHHPVYIKQQHIRYTKDMSTCQVMITIATFNRAKSVTGRTTPTPPRADGGRRLSLQYHFNQRGNQ